MNYANINKCDMTNGSGVRVSLFVSGCPHHCEGCFNEQTWNPESGNKFTKDTKDDILKLVNEDYISGLTLLGGEPLAQYNLNEVINLCKEAKAQQPNKQIWLWSGYTLEQIASDPDKQEILSYVDWLVDGKFDKTLSGVKGLKHRGSSNQKRYKITHDNGSWQPEFID